MQRLTRYVLFQIPGWILLALVLLAVRQWRDLPSWLIVAVLLGWAAKDALLYPFVKLAYETGDWRSPSDELVGRSGTAAQDLAPTGYVRIRGELWRATLVGDGRPVQRGQRVRVQGVDGMSLLVVTDPPDTRSAGSQGPSINP